LSEAIDWLERSLSNDTMTPTHLRASAHWAVGFVAMTRGDYALGLAHFEESLALWDLLHDEYGQLEAILGFAITAEFQGDDAQATHLYEEVLRRARGQYHELVTFTLANLGYAAYREGNFERSAVFAEEALTACRETSIFRFVALCFVAQVEIERGEHLRAAHLYFDSLIACQHLAHQIGIADAFAGLAGVAVATDQSIRAARVLGAVSTISERLGLRVFSFPVQHSRALEATRSALSHVAFEQAWEEGRSLSLNGAIVEADAIVAALSREIDPANS
jgi:tetratricopeptide (TPR) repeat protein